MLEASSITELIDRRRIALVSLREAMTQIELAQAIQWPSPSTNVDMDILAARGELVRGYTANTILTLEADVKVLHGMLQRMANGRNFPQSHNQ